MHIMDFGYSKLRRLFVVSFAKWCTAQWKVVAGREQTKTLLMSVAWDCSSSHKVRSWGVGCRCSVHHCSLCLSRLVTTLDPCCNTPNSAILSNELVPCLWLQEQRASSMKVIPVLDQSPKHHMWSCCSLWIPAGLSSFLRLNINIYATPGYSRQSAIQGTISSLCTPLTLPQ